MGLVQAGLSHTIEDSLLEVEVDGVSHDKAALIKILYNRGLLSCVDVGLRAENALQLLTILMLGVQVKLTNNEILELLWRPPGVLHGFQKRSSTECDLFWHFINAWLASHPKGHVEVHRVPDHKLVSCCGPLTKDLR